MSGIEITSAAVVFDRDSAARTTAELWSAVDAHPHSVSVIARAGSIAVVEGVLLTQSPDPVQTERNYLGRAVGISGVAVDAPIELRLSIDEEPPAGARWMGLREVIHALPEDQVELAATAIALANWRAAHRFCPKCGGPLHSVQAGWELNCAACGNSVFPRTDPAVIVRVTDADDRLLLGSNASWESNRYSLLAGFVEPGESAEAAVVREIFEESGVRVANPKFLASQAWPLPASLMLGFAASALSAELIPDGEEILDLRWFDRDSIVSDEILLPRRGSLARAIVEDWFGGPLPDAHVG